MPSTDSRTIPTIGFLARGLEPNTGDTYNGKAWRVTCDLAVEQGCHLLMIAGHFLEQSDQGETATTAVYRLINSKLISGGILSQTVTNRVTPDRLEMFGTDLPDVPLVTLSIPIPGRTCVGVDNAPGLREALRHLIDVHGCRKIVHVRGPSLNAEAELRLSVWRQELLRSGLAADDQLVVAGSFDFDDLSTIGQDVVDQIGGGFDAVFACNDVAAMRVMADLQALGIRVPEDCLVVGFDDIEGGQLSSPPLNTVRQPLEQQIRTAWVTLLDEKEGTPASISLPTSMVIRASCGCPREASTPKAFELLDFRGTLSELVAQNHARLSEFRWSVFDLHNFIRAMNRVSQWEELPSVLQEWLPKMGIGRFALLSTCTLTGQRSPFVCTTPPASVLPEAPPAFQVLTAQPADGLEPGRLVRGAEFSLQQWLPVEPSIHGLFPLVVGDRWFGVAVFQLSAEAGLLELTIQEQITSVLERFDREETYHRTVTQAKVREMAEAEGNRSLRQLVGEVAHEVNTPLGAIFSAVTSLTEKLQEVLVREQTMKELDDEGQTILTQLRAMGSPPALSASETRQARRKILSQTAQRGIEDLELLVDGLLELGIERGVQDLPWLNHPQLVGIVQHLVGVLRLVHAADITLRSAEKIKSFVNRLTASVAQPQDNPDHDP